MMHAWRFASCQQLSRGAVFRMQSARVNATARGVASAAERTAQVLHFEAKGEPPDALKLESRDVLECSGSQVLLRMLAAPVNPSDVNTVQGVYPLQPSDGVGGHEGVAEVVATGPDATNLKEGDHVVPLKSGLGTWRTLGVFQESDWHPVPRSLPLADAATIVINPVTALSMLEEFVELQEGECVIQNGANSAVGQYVIAMAAKRGLKTINIVRDRPDWQQMVNKLKNLGANLVATPENVREEAKASGLPQPKLGLNCVGGEVTTTMLKMLAQGGTLVTYGAMAKQPVTVPAPLLIFKDVRVRGFWCSGSSKAAQDHDIKRSLLDRVAKLVQEGQIAAECTKIPLDRWQEAFQQGVKKPLLVMP